MFAQSQWSVTYGCLSHWRLVNSFSCSNFNLRPFDRYWCFVSSSPKMTSSIRQCDWLHDIHNLPLHWQNNLFLPWCGKGLTLHKGTANEPMSPHPHPPLCAGFEHDKENITFQIDLWSLKGGFASGHRFPRNENLQDFPGGAVHSMLFINHLPT